tara:strand:+ start:46954 stop:47424 length:471 start_codon:yes stop_codon:yes gene_type:complete
LAFLKHYEKKEKRFWKQQFQCKPEDFEKQSGEQLNLNLWSIPLTDEIISFLVPYSGKVFEINLTHMDITNEDGNMLSNLTQLRYLKLKDTALIADCIPFLTKLKNLEELHLAFIKANCKDLLLLSQLKSLKLLIVGMDKINHGALSELLKKTQVWN